MFKVERTRRGRRTVGFVVLLAALAAPTVAARAADAATPAKGKILAKPCLDLRAGTNTSSILRGCIPYNTTITIECTDAGDHVRGPYGVTRIWDRTTYKGVTGYVPDAQVLTGTMAPVAPLCLGPHMGRVVNTRCLYLRTTPSLTAPYLTCIPNGTAIAIDCTTQGQKVTGPWRPSTVWDHTTYMGSTGFVPDARVYTATEKPVSKHC